MQLNETELYKIKGGGISTTLLNSVARLITTVLDLGRTVGTSIRRIYSKNYC